MKRERTSRASQFFEGDSGAKSAVIHVAAARPKNDSAIRRLT
jgi:hypothetical protein